MKLVFGIAIALSLIVSMAFAKDQELAPKDQKSVVIYLLSQVLICYEGDQEVYRTRVCTGRGWHNKTWKRYKERYWVISKDARGAKSRCLIPGKYNVLTPWKILLSESPDCQKGKLIRNHEYHSVPRYPDSNGCIRDPLGKGEWIYHWVQIKTPYDFKLEKAPVIPKPTSPKPEATIIVRGLFANYLTPAQQLTGLQKYFLSCRALYAGSAPRQ